MCPSTLVTVADGAYETHHARPGGCAGLSVDASAVDGRTVVRVGGELDMHTAPVLSGRLHEVTADASGLVVLDMSEVEFCDSQGLALLISWQKRSQRDGFTMVLRCPSPAVRRLFELTGTEALLNVE